MFVGTWTSLRLMFTGKLLKWSFGAKMNSFPSSKKFPSLSLSFISTALKYSYWKRTPKHTAWGPGQTAGRGLRALLRTWGPCPGHVIPGRFRVIHGSFHTGVTALYKYFPMSLNILGKHQWKKLHSISLGEKHFNSLNFEDKQRSSCSLHLRWRRLESKKKITSKHIMCRSHTCRGTIIKKWEGGRAGFWDTKGCAFTCEAWGRSHHAGDTPRGWLKGGSELCGHLEGNVPDRRDGKGKGPQMGVCWHVLQMAVSPSSSSSST